MFDKSPGFASLFTTEEEQVSRESPRLQRLQLLKAGVGVGVWFAIALNISLWSRDNDNRLWAWLGLLGIRSAAVVALLSRQEGMAKGEAIAGSVATMFGMIGGGL